MTTLLDASVGVGTESTFRTPVTVNRWNEFTDLSQDLAKSIKQGEGLRVNRRVDLAARRVQTSSMANIGLTLPVLSKGLGLWWSYCVGSSTSTLVSGSTYQVVHTLGDTPSFFTTQIGIPNASLSVDAYTYAGCMVNTWELDFPNDDILTLKPAVVGAQLATATSYATPSYASGASLFHFAGGTVFTGTLTQATTTALATAATAVGDVRGGTLSVDNQLDTGRLNFGNAGLISKPIPGLRKITASFDVEYDNTTFRDAVVNDTPMTILLNFVTPVAVGSGVETLQIVLPTVYFDSELAKPTNDGSTSVQSMSAQILDGGTYAPITVVQRTSDSAL